MDDFASAVLVAMVRHALAEDATGTVVALPADARAVRRGRQRRGAP